MNLLKHFNISTLSVPGVTNNNILVTISIHHQDVCLGKLSNGALLDEIFKAENDVRVLY